MCNSNHYVVRCHLFSAAVQYCKGRSINTSLWLWLWLWSGTCRCATTWNQHSSSYIGCRLSKELLICCVCLCIKSTTDKHYNTCQTVYPQFLQPVTDTSWGRLVQWSTFCLEQEPDLENVVFSTPVRPLEHSSFQLSGHYWHQYFQKTTQECTFWSCAPGRCCIAEPYKYYVDWLIEADPGQDSEPRWVRSGWGTGGLPTQPRNT